jgi:carboxyl-terminal processing protease
MRRILEDFNDKAVDVVILDLRRNGGGSLTEAINCTGLFINTGPVVQVKDQRGRVQAYDDVDRGMAWDGPLVVVTSKFSASASEILAGAIQDYHRGLIIGDESTHGKGTVQSLLDLGQQIFKIRNPKNMGALKITMQQFYRPNGDSTQKRGVLADIVLPSISNHMDVGEGDLDFAIDFDRVPAARYARSNLINEEMTNQIRIRSTRRLEKSEDFQQLIKNIKRYREQKELKTVSINEKEFFARRAEIDAEKEDEKALDESDKPKDQVVERDFYFNEVIAITLDYLDVLNMRKVARRN